MFLTHIFEQFSCLFSFSFAGADLRPLQGGFERHRDQFCAVPVTILAHPLYSVVCSSSAAQTVNGLQMGDSGMKVKHGAPRPNKVKVPGLETETLRLCFRKDLETGDETVANRDKWGQLMTVKHGSNLHKAPLQPASTERAGFHLLGVKSQVRGFRRALKKLSFILLVALGIDVV